jgi:hypothetical protein
MIKDGIESENEIGLTKFQSKKCLEARVLFSLRLCVFVEVFDPFGGFKIEYFDVILSMKSTFAENLTFVEHSRELKKMETFCDFYFPLILKKEMKITKIGKDCFVIRNNFSDYEMFYFYVFDLMNWDFSKFETPLFYGLTLFTEINRVGKIQIVGNEIYFVEKTKENERKKDRTSFAKEWTRKNEIPLNEMDFCREFLKLSGGGRIVPGMKRNTSITIKKSVHIIHSNDFMGYRSLNEIIFSSNGDLREIFGFQKCTSLCRVEFPSSLEMIGMEGFKGCTSLIELIFSSDSHLREISGFQLCTSLCQIALPSSLEMIGMEGFRGCTSLTAIVFSSNSHLRKINGFEGCTSLCRIEIPSSVKVIKTYGFQNCTSLIEIDFSSDSHL